MARILKWIGIALAGLLLALVVAVAAFSIFRMGMLPLMARGFRGPFAYGGFRFLGWAFLLGRLLFPLGLIALLVLFGFGIGRAFSGPRLRVASTPAANVPEAAPALATAPTATAPTATAACPNCGRTVQADWNNCPYCGAKLKGEDLIHPPEENIS